MATKKSVQMCCVSVDYRTYLLPATDGMRLVEIMQRAFECNARYDEGKTYELGPQPEVSLVLVKPSQVKEPLPMLRLGGPT